MGKPKSTRAREFGMPEYRCRIFVGIEEDADFRIVKRLIGPAGRNTKAIVDKSGGAQIRIRGRGSNEKETSTEPLSVYVNAKQEESFELASKLVLELIERLHVDYRDFCERIGRSSTRSPDHVIDKTGSVS